MDDQCIRAPSTGEVADFTFTWTTAQQRSASC